MVLQRRVGVALTLVVAVVAVAVVLTVPWSTDERPQLLHQPQTDALAIARDLVGGPASITACKVHSHIRSCRVVGPVGKRATCFLPKREDGSESSVWCWSDPPQRR